MSRWSEWLKSVPRAFSGSTVDLQSERVLRPPALWVANDRRNPSYLELVKKRNAVKVEAKGGLKIVPDRTGGAA